MTTERFIETTKIISSSFTRNSEDLTTMSDISADPKRENHPMTLANISVDNVVHDDGDRAENSRNVMIVVIVFVVALLILTILFAVVYSLRHENTNVVKTCLKGTKKEVFYIEIPKLHQTSSNSKETTYSNVPKQDIAPDNISMTC